MISFEDTAVAFASKSDFELKKARVLFTMMGCKFLVDVGSRITNIALKSGLPVKTIIKHTLYQHFCGGETLDECLVTIDRLGAEGVSTILDYGIEAKSSDEDFDRGLEGLIRSINFANGNPLVPFVSCKFTGLTSFSLLQKLHDGALLDEQERSACDRFEARLARLFDCAAKSDVAVYIDAEETWIQDAIDRFAAQLMSTYNRGKCVVYTTTQHYRHDRLEFLKTAVGDAREKGYLFGAKVVRGAYMEKERARAAEKGYPSPIHADKAAVDRDYNEALHYCLDNIDHVSFCVATHNEASCRELATMALERGLDPKHPHLHFSQLLGMSDNISFNLEKHDFKVSKYVPYGPVGDVIPYLIRRAQENTSVDAQVGRELQMVLAEIGRRAAGHGAPPVSRL